MSSIQAMLQEVVAAFSTPQGEACLASLGIDAAILKEVQGGECRDSVKYSRAMIGTLGVLAIVARVESGDENALDSVPSENRRIISEEIHRLLAENPRIFESYFATQLDRYQSFASDGDQRYRDRVRMFSQEIKAWAESFAAFPSVLEGALWDLETMAENRSLRIQRTGLRGLEHDTLARLFDACCNSADYAIALRELAVAPIEALQLVQPNAVEFMAKALFNALGWSTLASVYLLLVQNESPKSAKKKGTQALRSLAAIGAFVFNTVIKAIDPVGWKAWERECDRPSAPQRPESDSNEEADLIDTPEQVQRDQEEIDRLQNQIARHWDVAHRVIQGISLDREKIKANKVAAEEEAKKIARRIKANASARPSKLPSSGGTASAGTTSDCAIQRQDRPHRTMHISHRYDAFISYRRQEPDLSFARNLRRDLCSAGYSVAIDEIDFLANALFLEEMERCIKTSRFTLTVISSRYLESGNCVEEAVIGKVLDMHDKKRRIIPIIIEQVERPVWLYNIVGVDFTDSAPVVPPFEKLIGTLGSPCAIVADSELAPPQGKSRSKRQSGRSRS